MTTEDFAAVARAAGLKPIGQRPLFIAYLAEAWRRRAFATTLARYRIEADNERSRLGLLWVVLRPLLNAAMYGLIFGLILPSSTRPPNFIPFLVVGVFVFEFFSRAVSQGAKSVTANARLVQSLSFPRVLLPISVVIELAIEMAVMLVVLYVLILAFGERPQWSWLLAAPILAVMAVFNAGVAMIMARLSVHLRDLQQAIPFVTRLLFYASGIMFSLDLVLASHPVLLAVVHWLPTYDFITLTREVLIAGDPAPAIAWISAPLWAVVTFLTGLVFFWWAEVRYGIDD